MDLGLILLGNKNDVIVWVFGLSVKAYILYALLLFFATTFIFLIMVVNFFVFVGLFMFIILWGLLFG